MGSRGEEDGCGVHVDVRWHACSHSLRFLEYSLFFGIIVDGNIVHLAVFVFWGVPPPCMCFMYPWPLIPILDSSDSGFISVLLCFVRCGPGDAAPLRELKERKADITGVEVEIAKVDSKDVRG